MSITTDELFNVAGGGTEEKDLTDSQKIVLLWRSIMGYGFGTTRVPGLLEQMAATQKKHDLYFKIALWGGGVLGAVSQHANISEVLKAALAIFGH